MKAVYNKTGSISQETENGKSSTEEPPEAGNNFDYFLHSHRTHETGPHHVPWCFERLQPFESEPEPLINNPSVQKIIKRNTVVVLSREYRRKSSSSTASVRRKHGNDECNLDLFKKALLDQKGEKGNPYLAAPRRSAWNVPVITTPCLSHQGEILVDGSSCIDVSEEEDTNTNNEANNTSSFLQDYDEYEQQQPSPWSQSPAPSPAIMDSEVNPFFQSPPDIDDEAFNPVSPETYYDRASVPFPPPISNAHSIVHVPLFHPSDIIHSQPFSSSSANHSSHPAPIGILSFLAPIVPYPQVLLASLSSLSPFIASSLTNAIQNFHIKKQNHLYRRYSSNKTSIPKYSSNSQLRHSSSTSVISKEGYFDDIYDDDEDEEKSVTDFSNLTPTIQKRPDHLGSMSNFTRCSLETVTEQRMTPVNELPVSIDDDDQKSLSPSSAAIIEGWRAVSPTMGLPISASIPPHVICSDRHCNIHAKLSKSPQTASCTGHYIPKVTNADYFSSSTPDSKNIKHAAVRYRKKTKKRIKPKKYKRQLHKHQEDDGFYRHSLKIDKEAIGGFFVAPKSSLLRLIIDGIPIHVL